MIDLIGNNPELYFMNPYFYLDDWQEYWVVSDQMPMVGVQEVAILTASN